MQINQTPAPIRPHGVGEELMDCPGSRALSRAPGGVSCKPASAPGRLLGGIKGAPFPQGGGRRVIVTCLLGVRSIFDTGVLASLWGCSASPAETAGLGMGRHLRGSVGEGTNPAQEAAAVSPPCYEVMLLSPSPCAQPGVRDPCGSDTCDDPRCPCSWPSG